jgi:uncharacterized delta-60 repeat protein
VKASAVAAVCLCLLAVPAGRAAAAPGDFDRSFNESGMVDVLDEATAQAGAFDMAMGPNGSIFVLGRDRCGTFHCGRELVVTRFRSDGSVDPSYGLEGTATAFPGAFDIVGDPHIAVDSLGRAVVVAQQGGEIILTRLDPAGLPDPAFGGVRRLPSFSRSAATPLAVAVGDDGSIVVGSSWVEPSQEPGAEPPTGLQLDRLLANGSPDPSFGSAGVFRAWMASPASFFDSFALGRDGTAIAAGNTCCPPGEQSAVTGPLLLRVEPDGAGADPEYGAHLWGAGLAGRLGVPAGLSIYVRGLFLRRNGRLDIVLTAEKPTGGRRFGFLLRVRPDGRLDAAFGDRGVRRLPRPVDAAAVDSEGRIFAVSRSEDPTPALHAFRLRPNGRLDRTFGGGWVFLRDVTSFGDAEVAAYAGQRPVFFEGGQPECSPSRCVAHPFLIRLRGGTSHVTCLGHLATIVGTRRGETLRGTPGRDVIAALGGRDTVRAGRGNDFICGGPGGDRLLGGPGRDHVRP